MGKPTLSLGPEMKQLYVPFSEKDQAKALGARWNGKFWYIPSGISPAIFANFPQWLTPPAPSVLAKGPRWPLFIDLVPVTSWFSNLRSELSPSEWRAVQQQTFALANNCCEVCTGRGVHWPLECHERFVYDSHSHTQILTSTIALCPACHEASHMGLARVKGRFQAALSHLCRVNQWSAKQGDLHNREATREYILRSHSQWRLDLRWLEGFVVLSAATQAKIATHFAGQGTRCGTEIQEQIRRGGLKALPRGK